MLSCLIITGCAIAAMGAVRWRLRGGGFEALRRAPLAFAEIWWWGPILLLLLSGFDPRATVESDIALAAAFVGVRLWLLYGPTPATAAADADPWIRKLRIRWGRCLGTWWLIFPAEIYTARDVSSTADDGFRIALLLLTLGVMLGFGDGLTEVFRSADTSVRDQVMIGVGCFCLVPIVLTAARAPVVALASAVVLGCGLFVAFSEPARRRAWRRRAAELAASDAAEGSLGSRGAA